MKQGEFLSTFTKMLLEWHMDYQEGHEKHGEVDYPNDRSEQDWLEDIVCWLQSKGYNI